MEQFSDFIFLVVVLCENVPSSVSISYPYFIYLKNPSLKTKNGWEKELDNNQSMHKARSVFLVPAKRKGPINSGMFVHKLSN